ncbi:SIR2 family protein [Sphingomonas psychrotolerans]|uniref:SIR2 family protein n=1 Tax=Sphingomonas psychrotolerans TaxID=1327635 RepID=A0ABU3N399_9SPHN|nr:SIR2 family protein [Sphingomonas psychrotolerans]MDT8758751.1 SIR2 family protein [Sphingomonas psychrotolerans]
MAYLKGCNSGGKMHKHDPVRQLSFIQQALSQSRKPIGFFIGAGCPLSVRINERVEAGNKVTDPLIWDVAGLTKAIATQLGGDSKATWDKIVGIVNADGGDGSNIELLLSRVRTFASVAGSGEVRGLALTELKGLDTAICEIISREVAKELPNKDTPYHNLAVWSRSIRRERPVHIFTTNYDLLLEQALEESSAPYFDGFIGARKAFFDLGAVEDEGLLPPRWTRLWKIHGSLNWRLEKNQTVVRSDQKTADQSYLIYPSHLKYDQSRKMPYLAMLDRLKSFLLTPSALLFVCGYSFADEHINDVICRSLESNPGAQMFGGLYGKIDDPRYALARQCASETPNLSLFGFDGAIIGRNQGEWVSDDPDAVPLASGVIEKTGDGINFRLGDFAALGALLRNLAVGEASDGAD